MSKSRSSATRAPMAVRAANRGKTVKDQRHIEDVWWRRTEVPQPPTPIDPLADPSDCVHGCNGDCVESGSEKCGFTCHA
jgi:hypothetical protein